MGGLLILISMVTGRWPSSHSFDRCRVSGCQPGKRATVVWVASFVLLFIGAGLSPNPTPKELAAQKARNQERVERTVEERAVVAGGQPETETADLAYKLRVIAQPSLGDRETTQRRFGVPAARLVQLVFRLQDAAESRGRVGRTVYESQRGRHGTRGRAARPGKQSFQIVERSGLARQACKDRLPTQ